MKQYLLTLLLLVNMAALAQDCVVPVSYTIGLASTTGANCTYNFRPTVTTNATGGGLKLAEYTFVVGGTTQQVCYTGTPVRVVACTASFEAIAVAPNQLFPATTVTFPCTAGLNGTITVRGSTATRGSSTCHTTQIANGPLPVRLVSFAGVSVATGVKLTWQTAWEINNQQFAVERSPDARSFEAIGNVPGNGTTDRPSAYEFLDRQAGPDALYYYRLKQTDTNGEAAYSKIIPVRFSPETVFTATVYPNAAADGRFMVAAPDARNASYQLISLLGATIPISMSQTDDRNLVRIEAVNTLSKGIYLLRVISPDQSRQQTVSVLAN